jgi:hypothetical protein
MLSIILVSSPSEASGSGYWKLIDVDVEHHETRIENSDGSKLLGTISGGPGQFEATFLDQKRNWKMEYSVSGSWGEIPEILILREEVSVPLELSVGSYSISHPSDVGPFAELVVYFSYSSDSVEEARPRNFAGQIEVSDKGPSHVTATAKLLPPGPRSGNSQYFVVEVTARNLSSMHYWSKTFKYVYAWQAGEPPAEADRAVEYAVKAASDPRTVSPDGESTVEVSALLYEYDPGDSLSSRPVAGKTIYFTVNEQDGVIPGTLSSASAVTDEYGNATVTFTAPEGSLLKDARLVVTSATVTARAEELDVEDMAYINFTPERGKVFVQPGISGIVSSHGMVPPDRRFPALIAANFEDEDLQPLKDTEVTFSIREGDNHGMLRSPDGIEARKVVTRTDPEGWAEVQYFYASDEPPVDPVTETIEIRSRKMILPLTAEVTTGFNLVFERMESAYEGKGTVNAGEEIPFRVNIKDAWNPGVDLEKVVGFWGVDERSGSEMLFVRLEVENIGTVPDFLLDQLKLEKYPEALFSEDMQVRSFRDKGEMNMLWMSGNSLKGYQGYPRIRPMTTGNHYYEARLSLVDGSGREVFRTNHPAARAYFNIETGLPADAMQIFFLENPFRADTAEAKILRTALDVMGFGTVMSVVDAMYAINNGNVKELFSLLFSEAKGAILSKTGDISAAKKQMVDAYSSIALAEKIDFEIRKDRTGPIAAMEEGIFESLLDAFGLEKGQLVVLRGRGEQKLSVKTEKGPKQIPSKEREYFTDAETGITSLRSGESAFFIIPRDMTVEAGSESEFSRF